MKKKDTWGTWKVILINYIVLVLKNKPNLGQIWAREIQVHMTQDPPLWFASCVGVWMRPKEGSKRHLLFSFLKFV